MNYEGNMQKILCFSCLLLLAVACTSQPTEETDVPPAQLATETNLNATAPKAPSKTSADVQACAKLGTPLNFNDQRIIAFQKIIQLQILRIKAFPMTEASTEELAQVEAIRRRVTYPLLTSSLRPTTVTKRLRAESENFIKFLDERKKTDPQAQSLFDELTGHFLPLLENEQYWNCLETQTDFQEDLPEPYLQESKKPEGAKKDP
jgi:hypothetical protein